MNYLWNSIIFALNTTEDAQETRNLMRTLEYHGFDSSLLQVGEGCYNNCIEQCYVYTYSHEAWYLIKRLALAQCQESILHVDAFNHTVLYDCESENYYDLGTMSTVSACEAQKSEGYTRLGDTYFTILD